MTRAPSKNVKKPAESAPEPPVAVVTPESSTVETPIAFTPTSTSPLNRIRVWELAAVVGLFLALYIPFLGNYGLWDPWETHYAEVARRMLEDQDWVRLKWENESFRSKPVLTFWMVGAGFKLLGIADEGGYSGEMVSSSAVEWAVRLPFALWGVFGLSILWLALARL